MHTKLLWGPSAACTDRTVTGSSHVQSSLEDGSVVMSVRNADAATAASAPSVS